MSTPDNTIPPGITFKHTLTGHTNTVSDVAWSPDGRVLASASFDQTVRLWDAARGTLLHTLTGHTSSVWSVGWSPDGRTLASRSSDKTVRLWDAARRTLLHTLTGHTSAVYHAAWSPDGRVLASASSDQTVRLWDAARGTLLHTLTGHTSSVYNAAWSPDGRMLASASASFDQTVRLWDATRGMLLHTLTGHTNSVFHVAWSPDGRVVASCSGDKTVRLWDPARGTLLHTLTGHTNSVFHVAWSPDGRMLASDSRDQTVRLWDTTRGALLHILTGHTNSVNHVVWSPDGRVFASASSSGNPNYDAEVRLWRSDTWEPVAVLSDLKGECNIAWHPFVPLINQTHPTQEELIICVLGVFGVLLSAPSPETVHYTNAKVVLVGDSGVGKSGLGLVLTGKPFEATESTHGRHIWTLATQEGVHADNRKELHETLLWDLAGQRDYRLIHQLHLHDATVALVLFDASEDSDPFAGVRHWERALRLAGRARGENAVPLKTFLVAARTDRGGSSLSRARIQALVQELGFAGYFETSAKTGRNIAALHAAILEAIAWERLPRVTSTQLFQRIKQFLLSEKEAGRLLATTQELYLGFLQAEQTLAPPANLDAQFRTCLSLMEGSGLLRSLSFGGLVLLQPELLDAYASALVIAVKDEPGGLGTISEEGVRQGRFVIPQEERLPNRQQEQLLLIAMIEELLRHEIALREQGNLIFPSQTTRDYPDSAKQEGKTVSVTFDGPVLSVTTTLMVRLAQSGLFQKQELWKDAATYTSRVGGTFGFLLKQLGEERAELTLFFDQAAREELRFHFEAFVQEHLASHALAESIVRRRLFVCPSCAFNVSDQLLQMRTQRGFNWIDCPVCSTRMSLLDGAERLASPSTQVEAMNKQANSERDRQASISVIEGKRATGDFDVFLCHRGNDKPAVKKIGVKLMEKGILPWLDEWELLPGKPFQRLLEQQIKQIKAAAVFVGKNEVENWQQEELEALLSEFVRRGCPVIPVLLPDAPAEPKVPLFLRNRTWVDFRKSDPDPLERLIWGITGQRVVR